MEEPTSHRRPTYILRGHTTAIHALKFSQDNTRLVTGDSEGWVVSWSLAYKRPVVAWRAHENAVLGLAWWGLEALITHGRDSKLVVWQLRKQDEESLDKTLPVDNLPHAAKRPVILYELTVNTMNFCSFVAESDPISSASSNESMETTKPLLLAVPHTLDSEAVDIFHLPSTDRLATIPAPKFIKGGMAMSLYLQVLPSATTLVVAYESGHVVFYCNSSRSSDSSVTANGRPIVYKDEWKSIYAARPHSQPVLSLGASFDGEFLVSSSADSVVALHKFLPLVMERMDTEAIGNKHVTEEEAFNVIKTGHPGQQGISVGWNGSVFATAGWDGMVRIYDWEQMKEIHTLEWHRDGVYTTAFGCSERSNMHSGDVNEVENTQNQQLDAERLSKALLPASKDRATPVIPRLRKMAARRERQAQLTQWIAAGGKDSKITLWDVNH